MKHENLEQTGIHKWHKYHIVICADRALDPCPGPGSPRCGQHPAGNRAGPETGRAIDQYATVDQAGGQARTHKGGRILLEGDEITLSSTSKIEAKGSQGGGTVLVGGDWQGSNGVYQATKTTMQAGATIDASATVNGDGGKVVLWSDIHKADSVTTAVGNIKAEGGAIGGNGGQIETSGHNLAVDGIAVSTKAPQGHTGQWLLDPYDITISGTDSNSSNSGGTFTASANSATISAATIVTALDSTEVTISTAGAGTQTGNITVAYGSMISSGSANKLTLNAAGGIILGDGITRSGTGGLDLISGTGGLTAAGASSSAAIIDMSGGATVTISQGGNTTFGSTIKGTGALIKDGVGSLNLDSFDIIYTGATTIRGGTLKLSPKVQQFAFASSGVLVESGGTLELGYGAAGDNLGRCFQYCSGWIDLDQL